MTWHVPEAGPRPVPLRAVVQVDDRPARPGSRPVGGEDAAVGWVGDSAAVVDLVDGTPEGGLIVSPTDPETPRSCSPRSGLPRAWRHQQGITVTDEDYNGTKITTVDLGDISKLAGTAGSDVQVFALPVGHAQIAYAVTDQVVVIGSGPASSSTSSTRRPAPRWPRTRTTRSSSTGSARPRAPLRRHHRHPRGDREGPQSDPAGYKAYTTDIKPFLDPFDALIEAGSVSGDLTKSVVVVTVH